MAKEYTLPPDVSRSQIQSNVSISHIYNQRKYKLRSSNLQCNNSYIPTTSRQLSDINNRVSLRLTLHIYIIHNKLSKWYISYIARIVGSIMIIYRLYDSIHKVESRR